MEKEPHKHEIDDLIRQKLSPMTPNYDPRSWDLLSRKLDQDAATGPEIMDAIVRERLKRINTPYERRSWQRLALQLELEYRRTQAVIRYKSSEMILALLLLLVFSQWPPQEATVPTPPTAEAGGAGLPLVGLYPPTSPVPPAYEQAGREQAAHKSLSSPTQGVLAYSSPSSSGQMAAQSPWLETPPPAETSAVSEGEANPQMTTALQRELDAMPSLHERTPLGVHSLSGPHRLPMGVQPLNELASAKIKRVDRHREVAELSVSLKPEAKKTFFRIGFVGGPDYNRVITPPTRIGFDTVVALDRYSLGYHGGLTLGIERGRWEIETGAVYAARQYAPVPVLYVSGSLREGFFGAGLNNFELNTTNVPLNMRYNVVLRDKWRLYALGGLTLNLIMEANYYTVSESAFSTSFERPNDSDGGRGEAAGIPSSLERRLTKGWLQGGSFWENATFYGNAGAGLERYMSPRWTLFSQSVYQHSLLNFDGGLGPYLDRIHSMSIMFGVKVRL